MSKRSRSKKKHALSSKPKLRRSPLKNKSKATRGGRNVDHSNKYSNQKKRDEEETRIFGNTKEDSMRFDPYHHGETDSLMVMGPPKSELSVKSSNTHKAPLLKNKNSYDAQGRKSPNYERHTAGKWLYIMF